PTSRAPKNDGVVRAVTLVHKVWKDGSDTRDVAVKEERPRVLGGVLSDLVGEARVIPDQPEASIRVLFLPGAIEHPRFDLIVLRSGLTPARMERLVEVLHEVGGLAHDEEHIPGVAS